VRRWQEELDRIVAEEAAMKERHSAEERALKARRTKLDRLVAAAQAYVEFENEEDEQLAPEPMSDPIPESQETEAIQPRRVRRRRRAPRGGGKSWTATILRIVTSVDCGMSYPELKAEVRKTHLGSTLERTDKAFYGAIGKLDARGQAVRHNGRVFSPKAYQQFQADVAAGKIKDEPAGFVAGRESPNETAVRLFLAPRPNGATPAQIVDNLLNNPPVHLAVSKNRNSIYNLIANMRKKDKLIKRGSRYYLPRPKNEAPDPKGSSASSHNGRGNGTSLSSGKLELASPGAIPAHLGE
jgi:hypothetical protein